MAVCSGVQRGEGVNGRPVRHAKIATHRLSGPAIVTDPLDSGSGTPWSDWLRRWGVRAWWALGLGLSVYFLMVALGSVRVVVLPLLVGVFPGAVLLPAARWLRERGAPRALAALVVMVASLGLLVALGLLIGPPLAQGLSELGGDVREAWGTFRGWLVDGPLGLSDDQIDGYIETIWSTTNDEGGGGLLGGAVTLVEILVGAVMTVIIAFFILKDGDRIAAAVVERMPHDRADRTRKALVVGRRTLSQYIGGLALVGLFDAVFIGLGLHLIGVPLVIPIATIAFLASFMPLIGAWIGGLVGVAVAFVHGGIGTALLALAIITVVEQVEANVVAPIVFRHTLHLHPLVTIMGILVGATVFGIAGAFLAVPLLAVAVAVRQALVDDPERSFVTIAQVR